MEEVIIFEDIELETKNCDPGAPLDGLIHYCPIKIEPCPKELKELRDSWIDDVSKETACDLNAKQAVEKLPFGVAKVCWGLAKLPYSKLVDDPELLRAHAWVCIGDTYCDPTYEFAWANSGQLITDVSYYLDPEVMLQPSEDDYLKGIEKVENRAKYYLIPLCRMGEEYQMLVSVRLHGQKADKLLNAEHWLELKEIVLAIDWNQWNHVTLKFDYHNEPKQVEIFGNRSGFVLQDEDVGDLDKRKVLYRKESALIGNKTIYIAGTNRVIPAKHVVDLDEMIVALEHLFRKRSCGRWEDVADGYCSVIDAAKSGY